VRRPRARFIAQIQLGASSPRALFPNNNYMPCGGSLFMERFALCMAFKYPPRSRASWNISCLEECVLCCCCCCRVMKTIHTRRNLMIMWMLRQSSPLVGIIFILWELISHFHVAFIKDAPQSMIYTRHIFHCYIKVTRVSSHFSFLNLLSTLL
jgi:hypothetical protein